MGRKLGAHEGATLGEASIEAQYEGVKERGRKMEGVFDVTTSIDFSIAAWHLIADWLPQADGDRYRLPKSKLQLNKLPDEMKLLRSTLRDLANGSKHYTLDRKEIGKRVVSEIEPGMTSGWYSYFFHERIPGVTTEDGHYFSVRKLRDLILEYLHWVFDDNIPVANFPGELLRNIWWCRMANRAPDAIPPVGAILPTSGDSGFVIRPLEG